MSKAQPIIDDGLQISDIIDVYDEELTESQRLALKLGSTAGPIGREAMEPLLTDALRSLRKASLQEAEDNAYYLKGEIPPRFQSTH